MQVNVAQEKFDYELALGTPLDIAWEIAVDIGEVDGGWFAYATSNVNMFAALIEDKPDQVAVSELPIEHCLRPARRGSMAAFIGPTSATAYGTHARFLAQSPFSHGSAR